MCAGGKLKERAKGSDENTQGAKAPKTSANKLELSPHTKTVWSWQKTLSKNILYKETYLREVVRNSSPRRKDKSNGPTWKILKSQAGVIEGQARAPS